MMPVRHADMSGRAFWAVFLSIAIPGISVWLAILDHSYHPRIYRYNEDATILQISKSELDSNDLRRTFTIWWQTVKKNVRA